MLQMKENKKFRRRHKEMRKKVDEKFNSNKIVLMTVPPLRNIPGN